LNAAYLFIKNNKIYHEGESRIFCIDLWTGVASGNKSSRVIFYLVVVLMITVLSIALLKAKDIKHKMQRQEPSSGRENMSLERLLGW
jgi:hypothetical protein